MVRIIRVLIADNSTHAREGLRALLAIWPEIAVVGEAANGQDALRLVGECQPDVVLMDVQMPGLDGIAATRRIKQQWPAVRVIILTLYAAEQSAAQAAGADAFLIKGRAPELLLNALRLGGAGVTP